VFFVVVPLGLATVALAPRAVPERRPGRPGALDVRGAVLAAAELAALVLAITLAERAGPAARPTLAALAASAALLTAFAAAERRAPAPLLPARLLLDRRALTANLTVVANAGGFSGVLVLSTLHLQRALGFSALETGLAFVPLAVTAGAGGPLAGRLVARVGTRAVVAGGLVVTAGAVLWLSRGGDYLAAVLPAFAVAGMGFAMAAVPLMAEAVAGAGPERKGVAAGLFQTFTHIGGAVVLAALLVAAAARAGAAGELAGHRLALTLDAALLLAGAALAWARLPASAGRA